MVGCEIVKDQESKEPDTKLMEQIMELTKDHGILLGKGGRFGNTFRIQPPMCISAGDVEFVLDVMDRSIRQATQHNVNEDAANIDLFIKQT